MSSLYVTPRKAAPERYWEASGEFVHAAYTKRKDDDDFGQPGTLVRKVMDNAARDRLVSNVVGHLKKGVSEPVLARAFGIVGAAGLVRYRAKIADPKDAGVMLSTLAVGLACGVGLWMLALFATVFILGVLWVVESFEPKASQLFMLKVKATEPAAIKQKLEQLLTKNQLAFELRGTSQEELHYEVRVPLTKKTDRLSDVILKIDPENATAVEWEEKKEKK